MTRRIFLAGALAAVFLSGLPARATAQMSGADARDLARISNYLNGVTTLEGNFVQIGHDGELSEGLFYLRRPGRIARVGLDRVPGMRTSDEESRRPDSHQVHRSALAHALHPPEVRPAAGIAQAEHVAQF